MRILHAADLHLDSAFAGLDDEKAALFRQESRDTLRRMVVFVPAEAEFESGFYKWLERLCRMGEQLDGFQVVLPVSGNEDSVNAIATPAKGEGLG